MEAAVEAGARRQAAEAVAEAGEAEAEARRQAGVAEAEAGEAEAEAGRPRSRRLCRGQPRRWLAGRRLNNTQVLSTSFVRVAKEQARRGAVDLSITKCGGNQLNR